MKALNVAILAAILAVKIVTMLGGPTTIDGTTENTASTAEETQTSAKKSTEDEDINSTKPNVVQNHGQESTNSRGTSSRKPQRSESTATDETAPRVSSQVDGSSSINSRFFNSDAEMERLYRKEILKNRILEKLQLTQPPDTVSSLPEQIDRPRARQVGKYDNVDAKSQSMSKIYIYADEGNCFRFSLHHVIRIQRVRA